MKRARLESLKSRPLDGDTQMLKNLTHLQTDFAFQGFERSRKDGFNVIQQKLLRDVQP